MKPYNMGITTVQVEPKTLDKIRSVKLIMSATKGKQLSYDDTISSLADKFLAEKKA